MTYLTDLKLRILSQDRHPSFVELDRKVNPNINRTLPIPDDFVDEALEFECECNTDSACNCESRLIRGAIPEAVLFPYGGLALKIIRTAPPGTPGINLRFLLAPGQKHAFGDNVYKEHQEGCHSLDPVEGHSPSCPNRYERGSQSHLVAFFEKMTGQIPESLDRLSIEERLNLLTY